MNLKKQYLMYDLFGRCNGRTCGECSNFVSGRYHNKILRKCQVYGLSHSEATDWAKSCPACGMFNREWSGRKIIEQKKHFSNFRPEEPIEGQMDLFGGEFHESN